MPDKSCNNCNKARNAYIKTPETHCGCAFYSRIKHGLDLEREIDFEGAMFDNNFTNEEYSIGWMKSSRLDSNFCGGMMHNYSIIVKRTDYCDKWEKRI